MRRSIHLDVEKRIDEKAIPTKGIDPHVLARQAQ